MRGRWPETLLILFLLAVALPLRIPGLVTDFWLDEIWSWSLVWNWDGSSRVTSPSGVFTEVHQDNNNHLVTLWLYWSGPDAALWWYRVPTVLAGVGVVWLSGSLAARWFPDAAQPARWLTMILTAASQLLIVYSSEARGYMLAACTGLAAQCLLRPLLEQKAARFPLLFAACSSIGFLSHLSYLPVFCAQAVWCAVPVVGWTSLPRDRQRLPRVCIAFGIPALVVAWLWVVDLSKTHVGGGPLLSPWSVAIDALALPWGSNLESLFRMPAALVVVALVGAGLRLMYWDTTREKVVHAALLVVAPLILFGLAPAGLVYPRHFLVPLVLLFPLMGGALAVGTGARFGGLFFVALALAMVTTNGMQLERFYREGRGRWQAALVEIEQSGQPGLIPVGGDHDFRDGMLVTFHKARSGGTSPIVYVPQSAWNQFPPRWLILHALETDAIFEPTFTTPGASWTLRRSVPCPGPTGFAWGLYSSDAPSAPPMLDRARN